jgi:(p)ppGpp synthase/HD superfamily hydrolase
MSQSGSALNLKLGRCREAYPEPQIGGYISTPRRVNFHPSDSPTTRSSSSAGRLSAVQWSFSPRKDLFNAPAKARQCRIAQCVGFVRSTIYLSALNSGLYF